MKRLALAGVVVLWAQAALAVLPDERLADPALEARARALSLQLRCQVCQNQSIDDSNSPLAADLRRLVRERLTAGDSDSAVLAFMVARFGNYILLNPPVVRQTWLLWFGPIGLAAAAGLGLAMYYRRRRPALDAQPTRLAADEEAQLRRILDDRSATP